MRCTVYTVVWTVEFTDEFAGQEFYAKMIPLADRLFDEHLEELESEEP